MDLILSILSTFAVLFAMGLFFILPLSYVALSYVPNMVPRAVFLASFGLTFVVSTLACVMHLLFMYVF